MKCKIKLDKGAKMPIKNIINDNCYDVFSNEYCTINVGQTKLVDTGIKIEPERGWGIALRPRSGRSLQGIILGGGEVDNSYRGNIGVIIHNFTGEKLIINEGEKIAQIRPIKVEDIEFMVVNELSNTDRGGKGFGSSGNY